MVFIVSPQVVQTSIVAPCQLKKTFQLAFCVECLFFLIFDPYRSSYLTLLPFHHLPKALSLSPVITELKVMNTTTNGKIEVTVRRDLDAIVRAEH